MDPTSDLFDPLKAAVLHHRRGNIEEAFWLVFLSVHFGRNKRTGWRLMRDVYGSLGSNMRWDWARTRVNPKRLSAWLSAYQTALQGGDGVKRYFGNHRKYESLKASSPRSTGKVVESYVKWVRPPRTHQMIIQEALTNARANPRITFHYLYNSLDEVISFGRSARFDYLTMIGKLGFAKIEAGSTYMHGATGPLKGARLLFGGRKNAKITPLNLDGYLVRLEAALSLGIQGMQVLEDALCNWQKSPRKFKPFRS